MSAPRKLIVPAVGISRPTISRPIVVFPHPDSPTSPNVSPGRIERLTSATALTDPTRRRSIAPLVTGKSLTRCSAASKRPASLLVAGTVSGGSACPRRSPPILAVLPRGKKQANWWPEVAPVNRGSSSRQRSWANRQRGMNRQPVGGLIRSGGRPGIEYSRCLLRAAWSGSDSNSASV